MIKRFLNVLSTLRSEKGLIYVSVGNLFFTFFGAILWFFLATQMPTDEYGSLNYFISVAAIFTAVGLMGFDSTLTTFLAKGLHKIQGEASALVCVAAAVLSIALWLIYGSSPLILAFVGVLFFSLSSAELLGRHFYREFMLIMIGERIISLVSVPILFWLYGVEGALLGYALSYLPFSYRFFGSLKKFNLDLSVLKSVKSFFYHSYGLGLSKTFVYSSDKLIIMPLFGLTILGEYQLGIQMLTALSIIPLILYNYLLPQHAAGKSDKKRLRTIEVYGIIITVLLTLSMVFLMPLIVVAFFSDFYNSILSNQIVLFAAIPLSMVAIYNSVLLSREKSSMVIIGAIIFLLSQYALLVTLGTFFELIGLASATLIASAVQASFLYFVRIKNSPQENLNRQT
jgi:O-antigen/teichoic acid export membrane protein